MVIDMGDGVLLKPKTLFQATVLAEVSGTLKARTKAKTDAEIQKALKKDIQSKWRDSN